MGAAQAGVETRDPRGGAEDGAAELAQACRCRRQGGLQRDPRAVHRDPDYSAAYVILKTNAGVEGHGLTFTIESPAAAGWARWFRDALETAGAHVSVRFLGEKTVELTLHTINEYVIDHRFVEISFGL